MSEAELLLRDASGYLKAEDVRQIQSAYEFSEAAHEGQFRRTGEPYISHPLAVAKILAQWHLDSQALTAALLHDVMEDTAVTKSEISAAIRPHGRRAGRRRLQARPDRVRDPGASAGRKLPQDAAGDGARRARDPDQARRPPAQHAHAGCRAAEEARAHRARDARNLRADRQPPGPERALPGARGPLVPAPLPEPLPRADESGANRSAATGARSSTRSSTASSQRLADNKIEALVTGREKHLYTIYSKMRDKHLSFAKVLDIFAFRIIVKDVAACYLALGALHGLYKPIPGKFKDYIAIPKANGYQSLHTTLFGPFGSPIEIQIRTQEMHKIAEAGVASHWLYKSTDAQLSELQRKTHQWLQSLLEMQSESGRLGRVSRAPQGRPVPRRGLRVHAQGQDHGAAARRDRVDFAYAVHTDIGNRCVAAKINQELMPLRTELKNGDRVEIITAAHAKPNPPWLNYVVDRARRAPTSATS